MSKINREIKSITTYLKRIKQESKSNENYYVEKFEDIDKEIRSKDEIGYIWKEYRKSLTRVKEVESEQMYSSIGATEYFTYQNITRGMSMTFWQNYGGTFTGLGILGTFVGLTIGLYGIDMTSSDVEVLKAGIAELLSGVQLAFITSLFGILSAIFYGFIHNHKVKVLRENINKLTVEIEEILPRRSVEEWMHQNNEEARQQTKAIKNIGDDVAQAIYEGFDDHISEVIEKISMQLEEKVNPMFEKIYEAIDKLNNGGTNTVGEIIAEKTGSQIDKFSIVLSQLIDVIQESGIKSQEAMSEINEKMKDFVDKQQEIINQTMEKNVSQMKDATELFNDTMTKHNQEAKESYERMKEMIKRTEEILVRLRETTETLGEVFNPMRETIINLKSGLEYITEQINLKGK